MTKAVFYHAGCSVCVDAEQSLAEAKAADVRSAPARVVDGVANRIDHGADLSALEPYRC